MKIHFIGIGGTGMNGVAQLAAHAGHTVSGSDRATDLDIFQTLEKLGIRIVPQDGSGITEQTEAVVYSTAIENDNPDIL
ncbi:MAG: Mur ligase domain-containing protein, partial [Kiritimatiellales bacterium]